MTQTVASIDVGGTGTTTSTGTGSVVLNTSPTLVTPTVNTITSASSTALTLQTNNGSTAVTIDTSQNVGIGASAGGQRLLVQSAGTSTTAGGNVIARLQTNGSGYDATLQLSDNVSNSITMSMLSGATIFKQNGLESMRIDASGNVGIGTTATGTKLNVLLGTSYTIGSNWNSSVATFGQATSSGGIAGGALGVSFDTTNGATLSSLNPGVSWYQMQLAGTYIAFRTGGSATEAMRIDGGQNVLVGTTSLGGIGVSVYSQANNNGIGRADFNKSYNGNATGINFAYNGTGVGSIAYSNTAVAYNTSSDYRLKENVAPMTGALSAVQKLKPCTYTWKSNGTAGQGFIAHELQEVVPDCVTGEKDAVDAEGKPVYQGIDTSFLVATLTTAIQEQQVLITDLQARLNKAGL